MTDSGTPSPTALTAAAARAAHLLVDDEPHIFTDWLAATVLGDQAGPLLEYHRINGRHEVLAGARGMVTTRSRYTEDRLAAGAARRLRRGVPAAPPDPGLRSRPAGHPAVEAGPAGRRRSHRPRRRPVRPRRP